MNVLNGGFLCVGIPFLISLIGQGVSLGQVTVQLASGSGLLGKAASLNISLSASSRSPLAAAEWTLHYSSKDLSSMTVQASPSVISAGKSLSCAAGSGTISCVLWGVNQTAIPDGVIATANFSVASTAPASSALQIASVVVASPTAGNVAAAGNTATLTIAPPISKLSCGPASLVTPLSSTCTVTLASAALSPVAVSLGVATGSVSVLVPTSVTVAAGATTAAFTLQAGSVTALTNCVVVASLNSSSASFLLSLLPPSTSR